MYLGAERLEASRAIELDPLFECLCGERRGGERIHITPGNEDLALVCLIWDEGVVNVNIYRCDALCKRLEGEALCRAIVASFVFHVRGIQIFTRAGGAGRSLGHGGRGRAQVGRKIGCFFGVGHEDSVAPRMQNIACNSSLFAALKTDNSA